VCLEWGQATTNWRRRQAHAPVRVSEVRRNGVFWHVVVLTGGFFGIGLVIIGIDRVVAPTKPGRSQHGAPLADVGIRLP
jgi:hypothetical protein